MAMDVTISLDDSLQAELVAQTDEYNTRVRRPVDPVLTPSQFLRRDVRSDLAIAAQKRSDESKLSLREKYKAASPEIQAQVDALLNPVIPPLV